MDQVKNKSARRKRGSPVTIRQTATLDDLCALQQCLFERQFAMEGRLADALNSIQSGINELLGDYPA